MKRRNLIIIFLFIYITLLSSGSQAEKTGSKHFLGKMVLVPAGEFKMGSGKLDGQVGIEVGVDEFPVHTVYVPAFSIDILETTNREYKQFIDDTGNKIPKNKNHVYDPYIWKDGTYLPGHEYRPVVLIDWYDADAYCRWKGKRLPREPEWEKAARGTDRRIYPWGNKLDKMKANVMELGLQMSVTVGSFPNGKSPYGLYDMAGNVWEWTNDWYDRYPENRLKRNTYGKTHKVTRGGAWLQPAHIYGDTAERNPFPPDYSHRTVGFRCAKR